MELEAREIPTCCDGGSRSVKEKAPGWEVFLGHGGYSLKPDHRGAGR